MVDASGRGIKLFYCYAREDKALRDQLETYLKVLTRQYGLTHWSDREILPGEQWEQEIHAHLDTADIILLLISPDFVASDYCYGKEMQQALERHREGTCRVIPILLRPTYWEDTPFNNIQMLPTDAEPITSWPDRDKAFHDVVKGISSSIKAVLDSRKTPEEWIEEGSNHNKHERYKEAIYAYRQANRHTPASPAVYNGIGYALNGRKSYEYALKVLNKAIDLAPDHTYAYINKGKALTGLERYEEALAAFEQAIACDPSNAAAYKSKGDLLIRLERYKEALKVLDKAIACDPDDASTYYGKGIAFIKLERYKEALKVLDKAIEIDPKYHLAYIVEGYVLNKLKRYEEALAAFEQAIHINPDEATAHKMKGTILARFGRYGNALKALDKAIDIDADNANTYYLKGLVLKELRRYEEALAAFERTIVLARDKADGYLGKGIVFNKLKRYEEACSLLRQALSYKENNTTIINAVIINAIGDTLKGLKRYEEAEAAYKVARQRGYEASKTLFDMLL